MSEPMFTPGPWEVCNMTDVFSASGAARRDGLSADDNDGWAISDCSTGRSTSSAGGEYVLPLEEQKANARLIAAAPEMYEALKEMSATYGHVWDRTDGSLVCFPENIDRLDTAYAKAFEALQKAEGRS